MHNSKRYCFLALPVILSSMFFCSGLGDDSTNLGAAIIESIDSSRVTISKHIRDYVMDTSALDSSFSLPGVNDTGFGVHLITGAGLTIGDSAGDSAIGFAQFVISPDTGKPRWYAASDTLTQIILRFFRDTGSPARIEIRRSQGMGRPSKPSDTIGRPVAGTLNFTATDSTDSITFSPDSSFTRAIFAACTTTTRDTTYIKQLPAFGFMGTNLDPGIKVRFKSIPQMLIRFKRNARDTSFTYFPHQYCYIATDGNPDSLQRIPELSYAPKRTAVFHYDATALWDTIKAINGTANSQYAQILSAVFSLKGQKTGDTLTVWYLLLDTLERNGAVLDSLFAKNPSSPGVATIKDTSRVLANVHQSLQNFSQNGRRSDLYLYLRFAEDANQNWKKAVWNSIPLLTAMIAVP